jgi:hypothetical protein
MPIRIVAAPVDWRLELVLDEAKANPHSSGRVQLHCKTGCPIALCTLQPWRYFRICTNGTLRVYIFADTNSGGVVGNLGVQRSEWTHAQVTD